MSTSDFYEVDEPAERVIAAFERGDKRPTAAPTRIRIDPNIRVRGDHTLAEYADVDGLLVVGHTVEVHEPEAGIAGTGRVVEIDRERDLIVVAVDWSSLRRLR